MKHIPGIVCGTAIAAGMIFTVKALPLQMQGSVALLIGLTVGLAMGRLTAVSTHDGGPK